MEEEGGEGMCKVKATWCVMFSQRYLDMWVRREQLWRQRPGDVIVSVKFPRGPIWRRDNKEREKQFNTLYCNGTHSLEVDRFDSGNVVLILHLVVTSCNARMSNPYCLGEPLAQDMPWGPGSGTLILASLAHLNSLSLCSLIKKKLCRKFRNVNCFCWV